MVIKDVIGKRIVDVEQRRFYDEENRVTRYEVVWFTLDDGARVVFHPRETIDQPLVEATVVKPNKRKQATE